MRILGIDPGYERMGVAVIEKERGRAERLLWSDCLRTSARLDFLERLHSLGAEIESAITRWKPDAMALETLFFAKNQKTASAVAEVRGMLLYIAGCHGLAVHQFTPLQVKVATTGYGKAGKEQVAAMIRALLRPKKSPKLDDEYDAIAVALTCAANMSSLSTK